MVQFRQELERVLPEDLPHRGKLIEVASRHLDKIVAANEYMNLTRIISPEEAAVKHVWDCVAPWRLFSGSEKVLDAGTGAGFPGIPLSVVLPETRFTLAESVGKKARFVDIAADELELPNVTVVSERAETVAVLQKHKLITARAMAPLSKLIDMFRPSLNEGARLLLYKGPDIEGEISQMAQSKFTVDVVSRYELPGGLGSRTIVEIKAAAREKHPKRAAANRQ